MTFQHRRRVRPLVACILPTARNGNKIIFQLRKLQAEALSNQRSRSSRCLRPYTIIDATWFLPPIKIVPLFSSTVDKCARCDAHARCNNGHCKCREGWVGNGYDCVRGNTNLLMVIQILYLLQILPIFAKMADYLKTLKVVLKVAWTWFRLFRPSGWHFCKKNLPRTLKPGCIFPSQISPRLPLKIIVWGSVNHEFNSNFLNDSHPAISPKACLWSKLFNGSRLRF